jgi:hypothetical protein
MAARFALAAIATAAIASAQSFDSDATITPSTSAYWTYTTRYVESVTESLYTYYDDSVTTDTYTVTRTVKDDAATPTISPYSTSLYYNYDNLQLVYAFYTTSAVPESDLAPEYDYYSTAPATTTTITSIEFSMPVTMTAPASCPTPCK